MRIGSLFSGYGGLDLAVERYFGATAVWFVEFDKHPSTVLAQRWPGVVNHGDITAVDWAAVEPVDILTGGYPCQPFSHAGNRKGHADERHLWPYVKDALRVLRPRYGIFENVSGHISLGFDTVLADLAEIGFDAEWVVVRDRQQEPAGGAVPHTGGNGCSSLLGTPRAAMPDVDERPHHLLPTPRATDGTKGGPNQRGSSGDLMLPSAVQEGRFGPYAAAIHRWEQVLGRPAPSPTEPGKDGRPRLSPRFVEFMMGLPDGWVCDTGIPRNAQLKALGNGVVPQQCALALSILLPRLAEDIA